MPRSVARWATASRDRGTAHDQAIHVRQVHRRVEVGVIEEAEEEERRAPSGGDPVRRHGGQHRSGSQTSMRSSGLAAKSGRSTDVSPMM